MTKEEQFLKLVKENKAQIIKLFEEYKERDSKGFEFTSASGRFDIEDLIKSHSNAWIRCSLRGGSASMVYYAECIEVIIFMNKIWKQHLLTNTARQIKNKI